LKIKSLLDGFEKKLNDSLNDNSDIINEKIKSSIYKIYHPKCKKHLEKLELIEKSIKKYEDLPNSQKTEKIINHLKQRYKQINKWEVDSDDLIETITMKALELSCKTEPNLNEQNNLHVHKLSDKLDELTKIIDKMNQNPIVIPPINQLDPDESSDFQELNYSMNSITFEMMEKPSEIDVNKKEEIKVKLKGEIKGDIRMIKLGMKKGWEKEEIKENLKHTENKLTKIMEHFETHQEQLFEKNNESVIIGELEKDLGEFNEW
jgi:hypothetical protein